MDEPATELINGGFHSFDFRMQNGSTAVLPRVEGMPMIRAKTEVTDAGAVSVDVADGVRLPMPFTGLDFGDLEDPVGDVTWFLEEEMRHYQTIVGSSIGVRAVMLTRAIIAGNVAWPVDVVTAASVNPQDPSQMTAEIYAGGVAIPSIRYPKRKVDLHDIATYEVPRSFHLVNCMRDDMYVRASDGVLVPIQRKDELMPLTIERASTKIGVAQDDIPLSRIEVTGIGNLPEDVPEDTMLLVHSDVAQIAVLHGVSSKVIKKMVIGSSVERDPQSNCPLPIINSLSRIGVATMLRVCQVGF